LWPYIEKGARSFVGEKETKKFCGRKIATFVRPQGGTNVANWAIFRPQGRKITSSV